MKSVRTAPVVLAIAWAGCVASGVVEERSPSSEPSEAGAPLLEHEDSSAKCPPRCSSDLRSIDDCDGNEVRRCLDSEGCANGTCIPACEAAAAAQGTLGCEFFVAPMAFRHFFSGQKNGSCVAAMLANAGRVPATVSITHRGVPLDVGAGGRTPIARGGVVEYAPLPDGKIPAEGVAIVFLQQTEDGVCPAPPLVTGPMLTGTGFGEAFQIETSAPVNAYSVLPALTENVTLALLYPTASWGTSYVATVSEPADRERKEMSLQNEETGIVVVAREASTVIVTPPKDLVGDQDAGIRSVAAGASRHFDLPAGGTLQLSQRASLTGTVVRSDKPVAVLGASTWYQQTSRHQQMQPVRATGHRYAAIRPRDRLVAYPETHGWRFVGMVDGTKLSYYPTAPVDAPTELARGAVVSIETGDRFVVESQDAEHPFTLVEETRSPVGQTYGYALFESAPAVSLDQLVSAQLFYTVPGFKVGHLVVVREAGDDGMFRPVELDCLGPIDGWQSIDAAGRYQYALVDTPMFDLNTHTSKCALGRRTLQSRAPFGATVWGWSWGEAEFEASTYAYPAAVGLRPVNQVDVDVQ